MINNKKVFVLLPDGIGLRNFVYTSFAEIGEKKGWDITYWHNIPFNFSEFGFKEELLESKTAPLTDLYKRARKEIELQNFEKQFNDSVYRKYSFKPSSKNFKSKIKNRLVNYFIKKYKGEKLSRLRKKIIASERKTDYYKSCIQTLKTSKPALVFSTNQRPVNAIAPIVAAKDLGILTVTFIFSWDNLPKATMVIETDYYFVWSSYMKQELLKYYPYVNEDQVFVTGSPQFEPHFQKELVVPKKDFFKENLLPEDLEFICFSGDDITTSPHDPEYLETIALAVRKLNSKGHKLGIIFRRCPVDFSKRFDEVISTYKDVIFTVDPIWEKKGVVWNTVIPLKEDITQLVNTVFYSSLVINVGSSMVFDYVCHNKPCAYINFNPTKVANKKDIHTIYKYIHFKSMPSKEAVVWLSDPNPEVVADQLEGMLSNNIEPTVKNAKKWFETINQHPPELASERIWTHIDNLTLLN